MEQVMLEEKIWMAISFVTPGTRFTRRLKASDEVFHICDALWSMSTPQNNVDGNFNKEVPPQP